MGAVEDTGNLHMALNGHMPDSKVSFLCYGAINCIQRSLDNYNVVVEVDLVGYRIKLGTRYHEKNFC